MRCSRRALLISLCARGVVAASSADDSVNVHADTASLVQVKLKASDFGFQDAVANRPPSRELRKMMANADGALFLGADSNRDGRLSREEFQQMVGSDLDATRGEKGVDLFELADEDRDGAISRDELFSSSSSRGQSDWPSLKGLAKGVAQSESRVVDITWTSTEGHSAYGGQFVGLHPTSLRFDGDFHAITIVQRVGNRHFNLTQNVKLANDIVWGTQDLIVKATGKHMSGPPLVESKGKDFCAPAWWPMKSSKAHLGKVPMFGHVFEEAHNCTMTKSNASLVYHLPSNATGGPHDLEELFTIKHVLFIRVFKWVPVNEAAVAIDFCVKTKDHVELGCLHMNTGS